MKHFYFLLPEVQLQHIVWVIHIMIHYIKHRASTHCNALEGTALWSTFYFWDTTHEFKGWTCTPAVGLLPQVIFIRSVHSSQMRCWRIVTNVREYCWPLLPNLFTYWAWASKGGYSFPVEFPICCLRKWDSSLLPKRARLLPNGN